MYRRLVLLACVFFMASRVKAEEPEICAQGTWQIAQHWTSGSCSTAISFTTGWMPPPRHWASMWAGWLWDSCVLTVSCPLLTARLAVSKSSFLLQSRVGQCAGLITRKELLASWGVSAKRGILKAVFVPEAGNRHGEEGNAPKGWLRHWMQPSFSVPPDPRLLQAAMSPAAELSFRACDRINISSWFFSAVMILQAGLLNG